MSHATDGRAGRRTRDRGALRVGALGLGLASACALPHGPLLNAANTDARIDTPAREGSTTAGGDGARPDTRAPQDAPVVAPGDVTVPPGVDASMPRPDAVVPPMMDVVTPPPDVTTTRDAPSPTPDVVVPVPDVVVPADAPRMCGRPGQPCCAGSTCDHATLVCLAFGTASICSPCGGLGEACCGGDTCAAGSTCRALYSNSVRACVTNDGRSERTGGACLIPLSNCGTNGLVCVGNNRSGLSTYAYCLQCGGRGQPCCVSSQQCGSGLSCAMYPNDVYFCR